MLASRGLFPYGDIEVGLVVKVAGLRGATIGADLRSGRIAGEMVLFDMDVAVRHEAEVRPGTHLQGEEDEEQDYGPATGMPKIA